MDNWDEWLETPLGSYVVKREQAIYDRVLPDLFGYYALQIGSGRVPLMQTSRITHKFTLAWDTAASVLAEPDQLPFAENQFDLIVLPHTLEFQALPHEVLREVFRILRPEGRLLISGFNPYSMFGIKRYFGRDRSGPWGSEFISLSRAKDWLTLLGFDIVGGQLDCYTLPAQNDRTLQRLRWLEKTGDRSWPFAGGIYFLHAVKRVAGARLIKPAWARSGRRKRAAAAIPTRAGAAAQMPVQTDKESK